MAQEIFERYEKKYRISMKQYQALIGQLLERMTADSYGKHTICNIYFDTPDYQMIRRSLDKPEYKEKLRLRSYGVPGEEDTVYLELKKKYEGIVYKRRAGLPLSEARKFLYYGIRPQKDSQILREIDYTLRFYEARPMAYIAYDRIAFFGKEDPDLRITFDMNIRGRSCDLDLSRSTYGTLFLGRGELLMEVKIPEAMPLWMSHLFAELEIYPTNFSKYGTYYQDYIAAESAVRGGEICA
ncbi:MAG: polyphosphate polymerase domain-containing protein [Clostridiales bacterium]|nr:polyphosphate polymerase domain-containing protein [Clostridiales bacterium]